MAERSLVRRVIDSSRSFGLRRAAQKLSAITVFRAHDDHNVCIAVFRDGLVMCSGGRRQSSRKVYAPYDTVGESSRGCPHACARVHRWPSPKECFRVRVRVPRVAARVNRAAYGRKDCCRRLRGKLNATVEGERAPGNSWSWLVVLSRRRDGGTGGGFPGGSVNASYGFEYKYRRERKGCCRHDWGSKRMCHPDRECSQSCERDSCQRCPDTLTDRSCGPSDNPRAFARERVYSPLPSPRLFD